MTHVSEQWFGVSLNQIYRYFVLSTSPRKIMCNKKAVIKSNVTISQRLLHVTRTKKGKEKDEYYAKLAIKETRDKEIVSQEFFEDSSEKNRQTFKNAIELFNKRDIRKRGSVEFIYAALKHMKQFDCNR